MKRFAHAKINVLFPLETTVREFEYRLLLAAKFIQKDRRIFLGRQDALMQALPNLRGGLYVGKHLLQPYEPEDLTEYFALKDSRFIVLYLDEEGAVFPGGPEEWGRRLMIRVDPRLWDSEDFVCTWGDFQRDYYAHLAGTPGARCITTGHPRFDLFRQPHARYFDPVVARLREEFGSFVLVNTNFALANYTYGPSHIFSERYGYRPEDAGPSLRYWAHTNRVLSNFVEMIHEAAERFPNTKFVIRPHPSEEWSFYKTVFAGRTNIVVRHDGPVGPWLRAASAVIHDGCTTGIEAYFAGAYLINFRSQPESDNNAFLPNLFGWRCSNIGEVLSQLADGLDGAPAAEAELPQQALDLLFNFEHESFGVLTSVMEEAASQVKDAWSPQQVAVQAVEGPWRLSEGVKQVVRPFFRTKYHVWKRRKFRSFHREWVNQALERVAEVTGVRMRPTYVSARLLYLDLE